MPASAIDILLPRVGIPVSERPGVIHNIARQCFGKHMVSIAFLPHQMCHEHIRVPTIANSDGEALAFAYSGFDAGM